MTTVSWSESGTQRTGSWRSENAAPAPRDVVVITDDISADNPRSSGSETSVSLPGAVLISSAAMLVSSIGCP